MNLDKIYHVENLTKTEYVNELVKNGWHILSIGHKSITSYYDGVIGAGQAIFTVGAVKDVFDNFNLATITDREKFGYQDDEELPF